MRPVVRTAVAPAEADPITIKNSGRIVRFGHKFEMVNFMSIIFFKIVQILMIPVFGVVVVVAIVVTVEAVVEVEEVLTVEVRICSVVV